jgi:MerR family transcriptional regulator, heat shock protein HspR
MNPTPASEHGDGQATVRTTTRAVYVISVAAELAGMHPQTLRIYERRGLVNPARTTGGNRRYSDADIATLQRISELAGEGMNLEGIRRVMHLEVENARLRAELEQAREIARHAIVAAQDRRTSGGDLVPLHQAVAVFGKRASIFDRD